MSINPYEAPAYCAEDHGLARSPANRVAQIGFALSLTGVSGVALAGPFALVGPIGIILVRICVVAAFLSLPGLLVSVLGLFGSPRKYAIRGLILGVLGSLFLPTFSLGFQRYGFDAFFSLP
jgi:hypothetical protein